MSAIHFIRSHSPMTHINQQDFKPFRNVVPRCALIFLPLCVETDRNEIALIYVYSFYKYYVNHSLHNELIT